MFLVPSTTRKYGRIEIIAKIFDKLTSYEHEKLFPYPPLQLWQIVDSEETQIQQEKGRKVMSICTGTYFLETATFFEGKPTNYEEARNKGDKRKF